MSDTAQYTVLILLVVYLFCTFFLWSSPMCSSFLRYHSVVNMVVTLVLGGATAIVLTFNINADLDWVMLVVIIFGWGGVVLSATISFLVWAFQRRGVGIPRLPAPNGETKGYDAVFILGQKVPVVAMVTKKTQTSEEEISRVSGEVLEAYSKDGSPRVTLLMEKRKYN
ncbi:hypothetical protein HYV44_00925 [Candidatus Microgenomates bacterium]|nr:hypothetical protein [Candidatus Microgenomates bacterium]